MAIKLLLEKNNKYHNIMYDIRNAYLDKSIKSGNFDISKTDLSDLKISLKDPITKTAESIPTEAEVMRIIECAKTYMYKAAFSLTYDAGLRSHEIERLRWNQIKFDNLGALVNLSEKNQKPRTIRLTFSVEALKKWKEEYPVELKSDGFVFLTTDKSPLTYTALSAKFKVLLARSGLEKHYTMLSLRHARITHLILRKVPESKIKRIMWG